MYATEGKKNSPNICDTHFGLCNESKYNLASQNRVMTQRCLVLYRKKTLSQPKKEFKKHFLFPWICKLRNINLFKNQIMFLKEVTRAFLTITELLNPWIVYMLFLYK